MSLRVADSEPDRPAVVRQHRRFALRDASLGGVSIGGATIDVWRDGDGAQRWCARLLMPAGQSIGDGQLAGTTASGRTVSGTVGVGDIGPGPRGPRHVLATLHGQGPLIDAAAPEDPQTQG